MKKQTAIIAALLLVLTGCVTTTKTETFSTTTKFDAAQAKAMLSEGKNSIHGSALIRQAGGAVVTCAGNDVIIFPATAYTDEKMRALYGSIDRGYNPVSGGKNLIAKNEDPQYKEIFKKTVCDAQGFFKFNQVADGTFYITSSALWQAPGSGYQGGVLMQKVTVKGGETKEIVLAP